MPEEPQIIMKFDPEMDAANFSVNECDIPLPPSSQVTIFKKYFFA